MTTTSIPALEIGKQLVDFCRQGQNIEAINALYAENAVSVEAMADSPDMPQTMEGIESIRGKNEWWSANHEVHSAEVNGPFPHGERFAVHMKYDITSKCGPMAGNRMIMEEVGLYTVNNDKIVKEEFFYAM